MMKVIAKITKHKYDRTSNLCEGGILFFSMNSSFWLFWNANFNSWFRSWFIQNIRFRYFCEDHNFLLQVFCALFDKFKDVCEMYLDPPPHRLKLEHFCKDPVVFFYSVFLFFSFVLFVQGKKPLIWCNYKFSLYFVLKYIILNF